MSQTSLDADTQLNMIVNLLLGELIQPFGSILTSRCSKESQCLHLLTLLVSYNSAHISFVLNRKHRGGCLTSTVTGLLLSTLGFMKPQVWLCLVVTAAAKDTQFLLPVLNLSCDETLGKPLRRTSAPKDQLHEDRMSNLYVFL